MTRLANFWAEWLQLTRGPIDRASALSLGIRLCGLVLILAQARLTARLLGPAGYGTVATIIAASKVRALVAMFGLGPIALREVPARMTCGEEASLSGALRMSLMAILLFSILFAGITAVVFIPGLAESASVGERLACGGLLKIPLVLLGLLRDWAQGFNRIAGAQIPSEILRPAIMVSAMSLVLVLGPTFSPRDYLAIVLAASFLAVCLSSAILWQSDLRKLPRHSANPEFRSTV